VTSAGVEQQSRERILVRRLIFYAGMILLLTGCVPIGVRVQNMLALWTG
jgi:hypothetical protein